MKKRIEFFFLLLMVGLFGCDKIEGEDLVGKYVVDNDNSKRFLDHYRGCTIDIRKDSIFEISGCDDSIFNNIYTWTYYKDSERIMLRKDNDLNSWHVTTESGELMIYQGDIRERSERILFRKL